MNHRSRNSIEIRIWLLRKGITYTQIAKEVGLSDPLVSLTISGHRNTRRVLRWLIENGCPAELLALPSDMQKVA